MSNGPCPHGYPDRASCLDCLLDTEPPPTPGAPVKVEVERRFTAKFDGHCTECNLPIVPGQRLARTTDRRTIHSGCADA